jgi:deoxyribodipyrimidine photo-lyase
MRVPALRLRDVNGEPVRADGEWILYWMIAARRTRHSFALERALALARELDRPLVVLEALRCDHPWASARLHAFALAGMADNARAFATGGVLYHPYVEPAPGAGRGLLEALAARACCVVTDEFPAFFLPAMVQAAGAKLAVRLEAVDGNGLLPLRATQRVFHTAFSFRAFLQRELAPHLTERPAAEPLRGRATRPLRALQREILRRWPAADAALLAGEPAALARLLVDARVTPSPLSGGPVAGRSVLKRFVTERLARYEEGRNALVDGAASGLSPWLHWGHVGAHEVLAELERGGAWSARDVAGAAHGGRRGSWWGADAASEAFLDQLVTWRELGFHFAARRPDHDRYESLPEWARSTLAAHEGDARSPAYDRARLEAASTHDELWNAAQRQLVREGVMPNYLRMLWGKKVLEWSRSPREALEHLIELNNRYALDGRDPNSYSGIFWCLGRFDRPWGPQRPIFGSVRYMSSDATRRKLDVQPYLERWGERGLFDQRGGASLTAVP